MIIFTRILILRVQKAHPARVPDSVGVARTAGNSAASTFDGVPMRNAEIIREIFSVDLGAFF